MAGNDSSLPKLIQQMLEPDFYPHAKFDRRAFRRAAIDQSAAVALDLEIVHCLAPRQIIQQRLAARHGDISDATLDLIDRQEREFEPFDATEQRLLATIDTSQPFDPANWKNRWNHDADRA